MISAAENIADGVVEEPSEIQEHGGVIIAQGRLLMDLIDRILLFAASSSGNRLQALRPVQVADVLKQVRRNVASGAGRWNRDRAANSRGPASDYG